MKILIISQTVINKSNNMGKTLMSYFKGWNPQDIAQLFFHSFDPTNIDVCENYYRFSDVDAVKSILNRKIVGKSFKKKDVCIQDTAKRIDSGFARKAYVVGSKHSSLSLILRDSVWKISNWKNKHLIKWIEEFNPDIIFFAVGGSKFSYRIAYWISKKFNKPLVSLCLDDYYINNKNKNNFFGKCYYRPFIKIALKTLKSSSIVFTICDSMKSEYKKRFGLNCETLHTAAQYLKLNFSKQPFRVAYFGGLGYGRDYQLISLGKAISKLKNILGISAIDVYSACISESVISNLKKAEGIHFHGVISPSDVIERMKECVAVIHTESFDPKTIKEVQFSVSTKIAESLMYGPCLIAYGPKGIASIDYLQNNSAAYVITNPDDLEKGLIEIITNADLRKNIIQNAMILAMKIVFENLIPVRVREILERITYQNTYHNFCENNRHN